MADYIEDEISVQTKLQRYKVIKNELHSLLILFKASSNRPFYEVFGEDAKQVSHLLQIDLMRRTKGASIPYLFLEEKDMERLQSYSSINYHVFDYPSSNVDGQQLGFQDLKDIRDIQLQNRMTALRAARQKEQRSTSLER